MSKDKFQLTIGQAQQLEFAFQRNGWKAADVQKLCEGEVLLQVLSSIRGQNSVLEVDISRFNEWFSTRTANCLRNEKEAGYLGEGKVGDLISHTEKELLRIPNFGIRSLQEVKNFLMHYGLQLKPEEN